MLRLEAISASYGAIRALHEVTIEVQAGQFVAIVGPNGAGKTTLFKTISGLIKPDTGRIEFEGQDLLNLPARERAHLGIAHVPEGRQVFGNLSVLENLQMGATPQRGRADWARNLERCFSLFPVLAERRDQLAGTLSGGEQQMLAIARALMGRPELLLLDEPSLGLAPKLVGEVMAALAQLHRDGLTLLLVEQNAQAALEIADRGYVLEAGQLTLQGPAQELLANPSLRAAYLGG